MVGETLPDAAVAVLREEDLAQLATPQTTTAGPLTYQITLLSKASPQGMAPTQNDIVVPGKLKWSFETPHGMAAVERAAWAKLVEARTGKKRFTEPAYLSIVQPLIQRVQKEHTLISYEFLCKLLLIAAGKTPLVGSHDFKFCLSDSKHCFGGGGWDESFIHCR